MASKNIKKHIFYKVFGALGFKKLSFYKVFGALGFKKLSFYKVFGALGFKKLKKYAFIRSSAWPPALGFASRPFILKGFPFNLKGFILKSRNN